MSEYFTEPKSSRKMVKVELDLCNYSTITDLKNETGVDILSFSEKIDLANLEPNVDKLDFDKIKNIPTNLSNLKSKVNKLDVDKLLPLLVHLSKQSKLSSKR